MSSGTGETSSRLAMARPTGAIMSTVATLSMNADTTPANSDRATAAHMTFGVLLSSRSAMRFGIFDSMKNATVPIVPASIMRMFQSTAPGSSRGGTSPLTTNTAADPSAIHGRCFGSAISSTYVRMNTARANTFIKTTVSQFIKRDFYRAGIHTVKVSSFHTEAGAG